MCYKIRYLRKKAVILQPNLGDCAPKKINKQAKDMNISFENPDKVNGLMTITVEENDYKENVEKSLKDYKKKANLPGFRPGMVPMGIIRRQFGTSVKMDAINKLVEYNLIQEVGRLDAPGRPILFGTTEEFLRHFGTDSVDDLPAMNPVKVEDFKAEAEEEANVRLGV